jgi:phenylacetate-CoA ligase
MSASFPLQRARDWATGRYENLPSLAQDVLCSAYGVQEIVRRRGRLNDARRQIASINELHYNSESRRDLVEARLRRILRLARKLPGYEDVPLEHEGSALEQLSQWPVVTKGQVRSNPEAFLTRHPSSTDIFSLTSGTTGTPLKVWRTRDAFRELFRSSAASRSWFGVELRFRRASFTGKVVVPTHSDRVWRVNLPGRQLVLSQYHLRPRTLERYVRALRWWKPQVLDGYTSNLVELARLMKQQGLQLRIPLIVTTCEMLTESARALLEEVFQGRVSDKYGSSENLALAIECEEGSRHIFENVGVIEIVDDSGLRVPDGERGRIVLTTLVNELMPLVRYQIGDLGTLDGGGTCACGRTSPVLRWIEGREDDVVVGPDGRRIAIFAFNLLRGLDDVLAMQVVQHSLQDFLVRVVLVQTSVEDRARFETAIRDAFSRLIGPTESLTIEFRYEGSIERAPGGKIRNVVRDF